MLNTAIEAVRIGEKIVMKYFNQEKNIKHKGTFDLVTQADIECENAIVDFLKTKYPTHGFIVEEGQNLDNGQEYTWVIDPIDGTTSFSHNYPMFSISVGLFKNKKPFLGVVLLPVLNELFYAEKGKNAFLNDKKINVSDKSSIEKSLLSTGFPYNRENDLDVAIKNIHNVMKYAQGLRRSGSCAIDICYVAAGKTEGYWEGNLKIVDSAAARIILTEAGGKITDFKGNEIRDNTTQIVATNTKIHDELLSLIKGE